MRKGSAKAIDDGLRAEYDLSQLKGGVRGKYYQQAKAGTNLVLIEPDRARAFPDGESVNRALRLLLTTANSGAIIKALCLDPCECYAGSPGVGVSRKTLSAILNGRAGISP